jgi:hypothetical protein
MGEAFSAQPCCGAGQTDAIVRLGQHSTYQFRMSWAVRVMPATVLLTAPHQLQHSVVSNSIWGDDETMTCMKAQYKRQEGFI